MDMLLQQFDSPFTDRDGNVHNVSVYGRSRPSDTWQGWLVFEQRDGRRLSTPIETTQPNADAIRYWATGLTDAYFDGAYDRALARCRPQPAPAVAAPSPLVGFGVDSVERERRLADIEVDVVDLFRESRSKRMLAQRAFDELPYAHADIVRAIERLENERRLVRRTEEGNDWLAMD